MRSARIFLELRPVRGVNESLTIGLSLSVSRAGIPPLRSIKHSTFSEADHARRHSLGNELLLLPENPPPPRRVLFGLLVEYGRVIARPFASPFSRTAAPLTTARSARLSRLATRVVALVCVAVPPAGGVVTSIRAAVDPVLVATRLGCRGFCRLPVTHRTFRNPTLDGNPYPPVRLLQDRQFR